MTARELVDGAVAAARGGAWDDAVALASKASDQAFADGDDITFESSRRIGAALVLLRTAVSVHTHAPRVRKGRSPSVNGLVTIGGET